MTGLGSEREVSLDRFFVYINVWNFSYEVDFVRYIELYVYRSSQFFAFKFFNRAGENLLRLFFFTER